MEFPFSKFESGIGGKEKLRANGAFLALGSEVLTTTRESSGQLPRGSA